MNTFVLLIVKACLSADPSSCIQPTFVMQEEMTVEHCRHQAPMFLPQIMAQHPDFTVAAFACVEMHKERGV